MTSWVLHLKYMEFISRMTVNCMHNTSGLSPILKGNPFIDSLIFYRYIACFPWAALHSVGLGYVVTGILYRGLCPDALNDPTSVANLVKEIKSHVVCHGVNAIISAHVVHHIIPKSVDHLTENNVTSFPDE